MRVIVLQRHIDQGKKGDCTECAISLATAHAFAIDHPEYPDIFVTTFAAPGGVIGIAARQDQTKAYRVHLVRVIEADLETVKNFMALFDAGKPVAPFSFHVEFPDQSKG